MAKCIPEMNDGEYVCSICGFGRGMGLTVPFVMGCEGQPRPTPEEERTKREEELRIAQEAADELGIADLADHYIRALVRWWKAGRPKRSKEEVERIFNEHCKPCEFNINNKCGKCGCNVSTSGIAITNKVKMGTEGCPVEKWYAMDPKEYE
jgi:hypothetical protein